MFIAPHAWKSTHKHTYPEGSCRWPWYQWAVCCSLSRPGNVDALASLGALVVGEGIECPDFVSCIEIS